MVPTEPDRILKVALHRHLSLAIPLLADARLGVAGDDATGLPWSSLEGGQLNEFMYCVEDHQSRLSVCGRARHCSEALLWVYALY
jgi:hypothetical protein